MAIVRSISSVAFMAAIGAFLVFAHFAYLGFTGSMTDTSVEEDIGFGFDFLRLAVGAGLVALIIYAVYANYLRSPIEPAGAHD